MSFSLEKGADANSVTFAGKLTRFAAVIVKLSASVNGSWAGYPLQTVLEATPPNAFIVCLLLWKVDYRFSSRWRAPPVCAAPELR